MTEYFVTERPTRKPTHPGAVLRLQVFPALGLNKTKAAEALDISRQMLHRIIREDNPESISVGMALRIGKLCGNGPTIWLNMQRNYDLWHAEQEMSDILKAIPTMEAPARDEVVATA